MAGYAADEQDLSKRDLIVIGGSAGAVEAVRDIVRDLPLDLPAAVLVAIHRPSDAGADLLAGILDKAGPLPAVVAREGHHLARGRIYVAPPDRHLLLAVDGMHLLVRRGPRENCSRPAIDPLFRSAAAHGSTRVIGVLLTGLLDDGMAGLLAIKRCRGLAVVQDPKDAAYPEMPRNALAKVRVDHVLPLASIPQMLVDLAATPRPPPVKVPPEMSLEALIAAEEAFRACRTMSLWVSPRR